MIEIRRIWTFEAAHHLPNVDDDHKCKRPHGHSYRVEAWIRGPMHPVLGWIVDYAVLDFVWRNIHAKVDHQNLNEVIENPTAEYLVQWMYAELERGLEPHGAHVSELEIREGPHGACRMRIEGTPR